jgi:hypothetical protein
MDLNDLSIKLNQIIQILSMAISQLLTIILYAKSKKNIWITLHKKRHSPFSNRHHNRHAEHTKARQKIASVYKNFELYIMNVSPSSQQDIIFNFHV